MNYVKTLVSFACFYLGTINARFLVIRERILMGYAPLIVLGQKVVHHMSYSLHACTCSQERDMIDAGWRLQSKLESSLSSDESKVARWSSRTLDGRG